jgi:hypothetical protein
MWLLLLESSDDAAATAHNYLLVTQRALSPVLQFGNICSQQVHFRLYSDGILGRAIIEQQVSSCGITHDHTNLWIKICAASPRTVVFSQIFALVKKQFHVMTCIKIFLVVASLAHLALGHLLSGKASQASYNSRTNEWSRVAAVDSFHRRMGDTGDIQALNAQRLWWEWNYCTNAYPNKSFTPADAFVPAATVFLAGYPTGLKSDNVTCKEVTTRIGEIDVGKQTIFLPLYNFPVVDGSDDWKLGLCGSNTSEEAEAARFAFANSIAEFLNNPNTTKLLFYKVDNVDKAPEYLYDSRPYNLTGCSDHRTLLNYSSLLGYNGSDSCDAEPFQELNGLDAYPFLGWWGNDTRKWVDGEMHTYEFGFLGPIGFSGLECITAKYILTAKQKCVGFCIFLWLRRLLRWLFFWL